MSACGFFVGFQMRQIDNGNFNSIQICTSSRCETFFELNARDTREQLDAHGRNAHPDDLSLFHKKVSGESRRLKAKFFQNTHESFGVIWMDADPHIQIGSGARISVKGDGISSDDQILNAVGVEQLQEFFEVWR